MRRRFVHCSHRAGALCLGGVLLATGLARAQSSAPPPLLPEAAVRAIAAELSGTEARHTVQDLTLFHRMRGSRGFKAASDRIAERARSYGLTVEIISLPADGTAFYGTQRSRPAWDAEFAELWEQRKKASDGGKETPRGAKVADTWVDSERIASWEARPITLAEDSASGQAESDLVDVGAGTSESDYTGKQVRGKLVLAGAQPGAVAALAVDRFGAAGIVSYAQNQPTAWSKEDENLVRWGHLDTFPAPHTFAFMVSLKQARAWQQRMLAGDAVHLRAFVIAGQHRGSYDIATASIPGTADNGRLGGEEIVLSCHLDHQRPGANDNASGCATILEVARTLGKLIHDGKLAPPRRTLRFIWPAEVEGTVALLNARPEFAQRTRAVIHMDMVGGEAAATGAVFHVTRSPQSLPTFVNDVGEEIGRYVDLQTDAFASTGVATTPLVDPEGSKRALQAEMVDFTPGSDHEVWSEGSFRIPAIYLNDWPDRYIHTHADSVANIDSTKLLRAAFIGATSAWYLARLDSGQMPALWEVVRRHAIERSARALGRAADLRHLANSEARTDGDRDASVSLRFALAYEQGVVDSLAAFAPVPVATQEDAKALLATLREIAGPAAGPGSEALRDGAPIYHRMADPKGPMTVFGYSYFNDRLKVQKMPTPALLHREGLWGSEYAYEALNLVDGKRSAQDIRDALTAIFGPVPLSEVTEYLTALHRIGILEPNVPPGGAPGR